MTTSGDQESPAPRLTRMTVSNYRSIGEAVSIDFEPLTVLVGINGSGKSNLLDAPRFVADALTDGLERAIEDRHGFDSLWRDTGSRPAPLTVELDLEDNYRRASYRLQLKAPKKHPNDYSVQSERIEVTDLSSGRQHHFAIGARGGVDSSLDGLETPVWDGQSLALPAVGGHPALRPVVTALQRIKTYALFPEELRSPQKPGTRDYLAKFGDNWPDIVRKVMAGPAARDLRLSLEQLTGDIDDLRARRIGVGHQVAEFSHRRGGGTSQWFDAGRESDGTLRVAGILTALVQRPPLTLVGIEEPELTVHAGVVPVIVDYLRETSELSRVVVTTHSGDLLDQVPVAAIRVVDRIDGITRVTRLHEGQQQLVRRQLASAGELLRSQGLTPQET